MRRFTVLVSVLIVGSVICAGFTIAALSGDYGDKYRDIKEEYEISEFYETLEDEGFSTWNPGRLWPGSIDPMVSLSGTGIIDIVSGIGNSYYIVNS